MKRSGALSAALLVGVCPVWAQLERESVAGATELDHVSSPDRRQVVYYDYIDEWGDLNGGRLVIGPEDVAPGPTIGGPHERDEAWGVHAVRDHGPVQNRVNIVVVGDGYRPGELPAYADDVDSFIDGFFAEPPLSDYAENFNVFRVDVVSSESGVDEPDLGIFRDTALDMTFDCMGIAHLLCVDLGKVQAAAALAPAVDMVFAVANSSRYGGAGYATAHVATLAGAHGAAIDVGLHEFGHAFAGLADEYYSGSAHYDGPEVGEPNATIFMADELAEAHHKWSAWLDLPQVHTFEGCRYAQTGLYRPTYTSKMRNLAAPFREVNSEQLILEMYKHVDVIDGRSPIAKTVDCAAIQRNGLTVGTLRSGHPEMTVVWSVDGETIASGEPYLSPEDLVLSPGNHVVSAMVTDSTTQVRDETARTERMTGVEDWSVTNCVPAPCPAAGPCPDVPTLVSEY